MEPFIALSELQEQIRLALETELAEARWVVAEVSELKVNYAGHCYLELVERPVEGKSPVAQARAVIWAKSYKLISGYFRFQTGTDLTAGMKVLVKCNVSYHPLYGLSLTISDIDPAYTLGETERLRRQTIAKLQQEGVFDMNRELELPAVAQRLAVVCSATAAGYQDFRKQLDQSIYRFDIKLFAAAMQGDSAESSILAALDQIALREEGFDTVVVIRGGGSTSDLGAFDSYRLCATLAQFPLPVLTGIGHDKDVSVADLVAHTALKTPTAVATFLVDRAHELHQELETLYSTLTDRIRQSLMHEAARLENASILLQARVEKSLHAGLAVMEGMRRRLTEGVSNWLERRHAQLNLLEVSIAAANPQHILSRGYALLRDASGKAILSAGELTVGEVLHIELRDGTAKANITDITQLKPTK